VKIEKKKKYIYEATNKVQPQGSFEIFNTFICKTYNSFYVGIYEYTTYKKTAIPAVQ
jgi:hypothetical protein